MPRRGRRGGGLGRETPSQVRGREYRRNLAPTEVQSQVDYRNLQNQFEENLQKLQLYTCENCSRVLITDQPFDICSKCNKNALKYTVANFMDPGSVPIQLQDLSYVEQLLIARVQPVIRVYRVKSRGIPGQYAYGGNIINIGQDITEIARSLPRAPASLSTIVVRKETVNGHRDFIVRQEKILIALQFLKMNNPHFHDMIIDMNQLSQLPQNGSIYDMIPSADLPEIDSIQENFSEEIYESIIPNNILISEVDRIQSAVNNVISWPKSTEIINEFTCEGYVSMAFPALLPYGFAELNNNMRPKNMKVTPHEYFEFLMRFKDQRFAQDPRFRYFALNTVQRHQAIQQGTVFAKKTHFSGNIEQLKNQLSINPGIINSLYYWCGNIKGSKSYWFQRRNELESMIEQLVFEKNQLPTAFFTLSAADLWWPDLARLLGCNLEHEADLDESRMAQLRQQLINENPSIVEDYFTYRATLFVKNIICKIFPVTDYWFRFEFQHRGSCHLHGLLWMANAPDPRAFDNASLQELSSAKKYYDSLVSALNPMPLTPPSVVHPSRLRSTEVSLNDDRHFSELLNRLQRHTRCTKGYCLKFNGKEWICRFKYPKELQEQSSLKKDEKGRWVYTPKRNDSLINAHNPVIAQTWRANTDFSIVTSLHMVLQYICKYASKSEPASKNLKEMFQEIVESRAPDEVSRRAFTSLMMKVIGERDIGACETCHLLYGIPLYSCTRTFKKLIIRIDDFIPVNGTNTEENDSNSFVQFYNNRPPHLEEVTLFNFAKKFSKGRNNSVSKNRKEKIVQILPKVSDIESELYCKQKLMLHNYWRNEEDLKSLNESWLTAFIRQNNGQPGEIFPSSSAAEESEEELENVDDIQAFNDRDWMAISAAMPHALPIHVGLGNRDIDLHHDWKAVFYKYPDIKNKLSFIERSRESLVNQFESIESQAIIFNEQQNKVLSFVDHQLDNYEQCDQKLAIIQGKAGTGKSCVINEITRRVNTKFGCNATLLLAPTGVAANNIGGNTIHSGLKINPKEKSFQEFKGETKLAFEKELENVKFVIIDEASMLGLNLFFKCDLRMKQGKQCLNKLFGGLCVYLVGDWSQLPPVCDKGLYCPGYNIETIQSNSLYKQFTKVFFLTEIMRQQGDDQKPFRETLNRVANGTINEEDYKMLSSRFYINNINSDSIKEFEDAVHIMSKNNDIDRFNYEKLEQNKQPIALINAIHNCREASSASVDDAQGLSAQLRLCKGAKVILRKNLWVAKGLANGSVGKVVDIIYDPEVESENYNDVMPLCILASFEKYDGPVIYNNCVPILPVVSSFKKNGNSCTRKQFPLMLAYAISIHRSQGITLYKVIVNIGDSEFQVGLTYVALSRVKSLEGLLIKPSFNFDRLLKINNSQAMIGRRDELQRLWNMANEN